jgi:hypothetical protein
VQSSLQSSGSGPDLGLRSLVTERLKPLSDRIEAIDHLVSEHFDHELIEADKLHTCNGDTAPALLRAAHIALGRANNSAAVHEARNRRSM